MKEARSLNQLAWDVVAALQKEPGNEDVSSERWREIRMDLADSRREYLACGGPLTPSFKELLGEARNFLEKRR